MIIYKKKIDDLMKIIHLADSLWPLDTPTLFCVGSFRIAIGLHSSANFLEDDLKRPFYLTAGWAACKKRAQIFGTFNKFGIGTM